MWDLLRSVNEGSMTIILTTHYMEEAQMLCDRVALLNRGKLQKLGTPLSLIEEQGRYAVDERIEEKTRTTFFRTREDAIVFLAGTDSASFRDTTLEDVFVTCAGQRIEQL